MAKARPVGVITPTFTSLAGKVQMMQEGNK